jgi:hypothetical protein
MRVGHRFTTANEHDGAHAGFLEFVNQSEQAFVLKPALV